MTITKRRPIVGDKVRLLQQIYCLKKGDILTIIKDDHSNNPYLCVSVNGHEIWTSERSVELVEPVEPRHDPCIFGNSQVGSESVPVPVDPLADLKAAWNAGRGVRPKGEKKYFYKCKYDEAFPGKEWHPQYTPSHYEIEPGQATVDPLADVKAALKAGKRVRCIQPDGTMGQWRTDSFWYFHCPRENYEIEPGPIPEPKIEWVLGDKYLTRGGGTAVLVQFDPGTRLPNRLMFLGTGKDHWVTDAGDNSPDQINPHVGDIVKHLKDKS